MEKMTGIERMTNILKHKPIDRIGVREGFWTETRERWEQEGWVKPGENLDDLFEFDITNCWTFNMTADIDFVPQVVEETEETILTRDGNGALLRRPKGRSGTPEHVDFLVQDRAGWEEHIKPLLKPDERRIDFEAYRKSKEYTHKHNRFFAWAGLNVFECMHPVCGHMNMLIGMADDPEWIEDMVKTYSELIISLLEILFAKEGKPDAIWVFEDLGFKERPFMSPAMYSELIQPGHKRTFDFAHSLGLPVIMHSCGFVEPLLPSMIEAGIDMLQAMEVKAGMDLLRIHKNYGEKIGLMGGIDVRTLCTNDRSVIDRELESKIPFVKQGFGYVLHSDHSIPKEVNYDTYCYFLERGRELGTY